MNTREHNLRLVYRHTHRDYKGKIDGVKSILVNRDGATCLVPLADLTDAEIAARLPKITVADKPSTYQGLGDRWYSEGA